MSSKHAWPPQGGGIPPDPSLYDGHAPRHLPKRSRSDKALVIHIKAIHAELRGKYGWPLMHGELRNRGLRVGKERVRQLVQHHGMRSPKHDPPLPRLWRKRVSGFAEDDVPGQQSNVLVGRMALGGTTKSARRCVRTVDQAAPGRQRRIHSAEFKARPVQASQQQDDSMTAVAMARKGLLRGIEMRRLYDRNGSGAPVRTSHARSFAAKPRATRLRPPGLGAEAVVASSVRRMTGDGCS